MVLPIYSVIVKIDKSVVEAPRILGEFFSRFHKDNSSAQPSRRSFRNYHGVCPSVSTFVISRLLGGGKSMLLGDLIEMQFLGSAYNPHLGSAISLIMMIIIVVCMMIIIASERARNRR